MKRLLLDTGIASDFINHRGDVASRAREERQRGARIGTAIPVVAELHYGVENSDTRDANMDVLKRGLVGLPIWPFDRPAAEEFGRLAASLRRAGRPIPIVDIMIAAVALTLGNCTVITKDSDFAAIPGLSVENWAA